jgi:hypothetical protein
VVHYIKILSRFLTTTLQQPPQHQKMGKSRPKNDPSYEGRLSLTVNALKNEKMKKVRHTARLYDISTTILTG